LDTGLERIEFGFTPKQSIATATADGQQYTLFGGFRGPGKSYWLRWYLLRFLLLCNAHGLRNVQVGLFCEDYPVLRDRQISKIRAEFPRSLGRVKSTQTNGLGFYLNNEMGVILLRNLDDPSKYLGAEMAAIAVDQLERNAEPTFNQLRGSLRWPGIRNTRFIATANPGGIGHHFVKRLWIDRDYPEEMQPIADRFAFVPASPHDNPHLDSAYWEMLATLPEELRRAWLEGDWEAFEGQAFKAYRKERHVCAAFAIPAHWPRWRAIDWGHDNPMCCLWLTKDPDTGRVIAFRELYETDLTDRQQARKVKELTGEKIMATFSDPSMWTKKTFEDRTYSTADEYAAEGVPLTKADNNRMQGKRKVDTLLEDLDDGFPGLMIFENCRNLIRTLPALPHDKVQVEDVDTKAEDHAYDALRYGLTQIVPRPAPKPKQPQPRPAGRIERIAQRREGPLRGKDL
jgi:phage terminase large subunit